MYAYKDILELAGLTTRLYALLSALHNLPPLPASSPADDGISRVTLDNVDVSIPASAAQEAPLVKSLGLTLSAGEHLMITGSNGVGKTAVARVLAGLWRPGNEGECKIHRPGRGELFVVPQRAYMVAGSLLDQYVSCISGCVLRLTKTDLKGDIPAYIPPILAVRADDGRVDGDPGGGAFIVHTFKGGGLADTEGMERRVERRRKTEGE